MSVKKSLCKGIVLSFVMFFIFCVFVTASASAGTLARWYFDGDALDSAGNNDGTEYGVTYEAGQNSGQAVRTGVSKWITVDDQDNDFKFGRTMFSIDFWMKMDDTTIEGLQPIITNKQVGNNDSGFSVFYSHWGAAGWDRLIFKIADGTTSMGIMTPDNVIQAGQWYYVQVVRDGTESNIYINYEAQIDGPTANMDLMDIGGGIKIRNAQEVVTDTYDHLQIGAGPSFVFRGLIDNLSIHLNWW